MVPVRRVFSFLSRRRSCAALLLAEAIVLSIQSCGPPRPPETPVLEADLHESKTRALALIESGDYRRAAEALEPYAARKVADPQVYTILGEAFWKLGDTERAVGLFESSLRLDYGSYLTHMKLGELLMKTGKTGRALTELELAVQHAPAEALPHYNYGLALYEVGRVGEALGQWERAATLDPNDARYAEAMGMGLTGRDDARALEYFRRAEDRGAEGASFRNNYGVLLRRVGRLDQAERSFAQAHAAEPQNSLYASNLALLYMARGRFERAAPLWEELHARDPSNRAYRIYLGRAYLELERFGDAVDVLETWLVEEASKPARPKNPVLPQDPSPELDEGFDILAMSHRGLGRLDRAAVHIARAVKLAPRSVTHLINYGVILAESGNIPEARAKWEEALRLEPDNPVAKQNLLRFQR